MTDEENPMVPADSDDAPDRWTQQPNRQLRRATMRLTGEINPKRSRVRRRINRISKQKGWSE